MKATHMVGAMPVEVWPRERVEKIAHIIGPLSAAAMALKHVDERHGGNASICTVADDEVFVVVPNDHLEELNA